jgi:type II secretory pathway component GspD/PulD (secretin)
MRYSIKLLLFFILVTMLGCKSVPIEKKEAIDNFVAKANNNAEAAQNDQAPKALPRSLIQFTYGPKSLNSPTFLAYLVKSGANLPTDLLKQLKDQENTYRASNDNDRSDLNEIINAKIPIYQRQLTLYKSLNERASITYSGMPIQKAFESISSKVGLTADTDSIRKLDIRLSGKYEGKLLEIMNVIAKNNQITLKLSTDSKTIKFSQQQEEFDALNKLNLSALEDIEFASHDFETLRKKLTSASNEITDLIPSIKSKLVIGMAKDFVYEINTKLIFKQRDEENSELRKALITYAENSNIENLSLNLPKTVAIFDPKVENGNERVIEKFSVYNDTPEAMAKLLQDYSIFKQGCSPTSQNTSSNATVSSNQSVPTTNASVSSATVNASSVSASSVIGQNTPINLSNNSNVSANENSQSKNTTLVTQTEPVIERIKSGCVIFNKDSTGIIAAGSIVDVQLVERILLDQDRPIKQAMIEVFILEVNSDWRQQIQSKISTQGGYAGTQDFSLGMQSLPGVTTGGFVTLNVGGRNQIQSLVNLIETNLAGRKISNPLILVKDGQTGVVNKVRTARAQITSPATVSAGVTTPATTQVVDLPSPLTLTVTPKINKHNDNIDLNFSFSETTLDSDSVTSATTQNQITSQLTIQPGQVIVMAGLKKETNSKQSDGLPFISGLGLKSVLGPIAGLFGGNYSAQQTGSELLVLIYPTVITNQTLGQTLNRAY